MCNNIWHSKNEECTIEHFKFLDNGGFHDLFNHYIYVSFQTIMMTAKQKQETFG